MDTEIIKCEVSDYIALVTMDHPPVNAQNALFHQEMMHPHSSMACLANR